MISDLLALLGSPSLRPLLLIFIPATITGMIVLPNATLHFIDDSPTFDTSVSGEEMKLSSTDTSNNCSKCHSKAETQLHNSPIHEDLSCTDCHNKSQSTDCKENMRGVKCMECHEGYHRAGGFGFGLTGSPNDTTHAAHMGFINNAIKDTKMLGANEACIACHTRAPVRINWTHRASLDIDVVIAENTSNQHFDVENWNGKSNYTVGK